MIELLSDDRKWVVHVMRKKQKRLPLKRNDKTEFLSTQFHNLNIFAPHF